MFDNDEFNKETSNIISRLIDKIKYNWDIMYDFIVMSYLNSPIDGYRNKLVYLSSDYKYKNIKSIEDLYKLFIDNNVKPYVI